MNMTAIQFERTPIIGARISQVPGALMLWALLGALALPNIAAAEFVFYVQDKEDLSDSLVGDSDCKTNAGTCTLRAAIEEISGHSCEGSYNRIILVPDTNLLKPDAYLLTQGPALKIGIPGEKIPDYNVCVQIEGTADNGGPAATVIDGNAPTGTDDPRMDSVFYVPSYGKLLLSGVTITKGHNHFPGGGAIRNEGELMIYGSLLTKNSTHGQGGAIHNKGKLWVNESTLSYNWSRPNFYPKAGGAIANVGGSVLMYNVTVSGNRGGLDANNRSSTKGDGGGGILNVEGGVFQMNNTTVSHNQTYRYGTGGGIYNDASSYARMWNTIVANNYYTNPTNRDDCRGTLESIGYNLVGDETDGCTVNRGPGDQIGGSVYTDPNTGEERYQSPINPLLGDLRQNGGPTPTHALFAGSPAIDAGNPDPAGYGACAEYDQRYLARPKDGPAQSGFDGSAVCDIGAYEYGAPELSVFDRADTEGNSGTKNMSFRVRLSYPSVEPIIVYYGTANGSAKAGSDYQAASGSVLFKPGEVAKSIVVKIVGDRTKEPNETLFLNISVRSGLARIGDGQAVGTIRSDD